MISDENADKHLQRVGLSLGGEVQRFGVNPDARRRSDLFTSPLFATKLSRKRLGFHQLDHRWKLRLEKDDAYSDHAQRP